MKKILLLNNGWFTTIGSFSCLVLGISMVGLVVWLEPPKIVYIIFLTIGLVLVGLAGYEARARAIGLEPPFTRDPLGWRKAKESYNTPEDFKGAKEAKSDRRDTDSTAN
jgi:hypothetical protein